METKTATIKLLQEVVAKHVVLVVAANVVWRLLVPGLILHAATTVVDGDFHWHSHIIWCVSQFGW